MKKLLVLLALAFLVTGCTLGGTNSQTVAGQLKGNQALLLTLSNANDLTDLYFYYNGGTTDATAKSQTTSQCPTPTAQQVAAANSAAQQAYNSAIESGADDTTAQQQYDQTYNSALPPCSSSTTTKGGTSPNPGYGLVQVGELNVLMQNVGDAVTAGGLYVSGYDPNLVTVQSRLGQDPINTKDKRNCYQQIGIADTGQYDLAMFCDDLTNNYGVGVNVGGNYNGGFDGISSITGTIRNPLQFLGSIIGGTVGQNIDAFAKIGLFTQSRVDCGVTNGRFGCLIHLGNPNFMPSRASHGYLLTNIDYGFIANCTNGCRTIPRDFSLGHVIHGIAQDYPQGEAYYADYEILVNRQNWNPLLNDLPQSFQITACYVYTTVVTPSVCVVPDPSMIRNAPCSPAPILFKGSQGAPIAVTEIDQSPRPGTAAFTIYIKHVGNGQVWLPGAFDQCSPYSPVRPDPQMMNAVELLDARISGDIRQLTCLGQSWDPTDTDNSAKRRVVRLDSQGNGQITCLYPLTDIGTSRTPYLSSLTLEFGYVYQNSIRKDVVIHRT